MFLSGLLEIGLLVTMTLQQSDFSRDQPTIQAMPRAYYLSPSGNDENPGTRNAAFQSIKRLNKILFHPGDSVLFKGGRHFRGSLTIHPENSGDQQHPILISSFGDGQAFLDAGEGSSLILMGAQWLLIKKLMLTGSGRKEGNRRDGLSMINCQHVVIDSVEITGFQKSGLHIDFSEDVVIRHVFAHENGFAGISVGGANPSKKSNHNIYVGNCRAENNPGDPTNLRNHSGNGIVVSGCTKVLIEYCTATNNGWDMPRKGNGPVGIWAYEADSVIIQHCLSYKNKTSLGGADGGGFDLDGGVTHSIVQYCLSYDNQGAGYCLFQYLYASPWHDNIFRFNISENDGAVSDAHGGVYIWNNTADPNQFYNALLYNNTIYNDEGAAIVFADLSQRKNFAWYNNIFIARDSLVRGLKGQDILRSNDWWSLTRNPSNSQLLHRNPGFLKAGHAGLTSASGIKKFDHYKIPRNSPLRKNGTHLESLYGVDSVNADFNGHQPPSGGVGASF
jgi:hypothetical protein